MRGVLACLVLVAACGYPKLPRLGDDDTGSDAANDSIDAPAGFAPAHLDPTMLLEGAPDLVVTNVTGIATINTTTLTINGANNAFFVRQGPYAVIYANAFSVQGATQVQGANPLIVVANDAITISSSVNAVGTGTVPGPGAISTGVGVGSPGQTFASSPRESSGGGGGSYGSLGGPGGTGDPTKIPAGASGVRYGMNPTDPLVGGSAGGAGGFSSGVSALGGVGGGAIQLSSAISVGITATINVGGGGGGTGGTGLAGGGGGGSGGEIFVEAPMITISGTLAANGGGGGGGGSDSSNPSTVGADGAPGPGVAQGGTGGVPEGSPGGAGAAGTTGSFIDAKAGDGENSKGGGGGGGAGRIWLRFHAATPPNLTNGRITPPATNDTTLP